MRGVLVLFLARLAVSAFAVLTPPHSFGNDADGGDTDKNVDEILEPGNAPKNRVDEVVVEQGNETPVETTNNEERLRDNARLAAATFHSKEGLDICIQCSVNG